MNSLNLRQIDGGNIIKQADSGSLFKFELLDENHKKFEEKLGDTATVILKKDTVAVFKKIVAVTDNCVAFNLDKILEVGDYILEIIVDSYVFPSNNRLKISVESTYGDYQPENLVRITYEEIDEKINKLKDRLNDLNVAGQTEMLMRIENLEAKEDSDTIYDDSELVSRVTALENKPDKDTIYDDALLKEEISETKSKVNSLSKKVSSLEQKEDHDTIYDDSDIKRRITALEQKEDHDTIYNDTEIKQSVADVDTKVDNLSEKVTALEERPIVDTAIKKELSQLNESIAKKKLYYAYANDENGTKGFTKADVYDWFYRELYPYFGISDKDSDNPNDYIWMPARLASNDKLDGAIIEINKLKKLHEARRPPTSYTLDRTTTPWTVWFDNGCGLQFPSYSPRNDEDSDGENTIYGFGYSTNISNTVPYQFPLPQSIIAASMGHISLLKFGKHDVNSFIYWDTNTKVLNPIRDDADKYDWSRCYGENGNDVAWKATRKTVFPRVCYELGIWSEADVLYLGATKK